MRAQKLAVAAVWMAAVAGPGFGQSRPAADLRVPAYMDHQGGGDLRGASLAKAITSKMLRRVGVTLLWVDSKSCPPEGNPHHADRHSDHGVMKAHWGGADFYQMPWSELSIAQEDIDLVHLGIEGRVQLAAAHTNQNSLAAALAPPPQPAKIDPHIFFAVTM